MRRSQRQRRQDGRSSRQRLIATTVFDLTVGLAMCLAAFTAYAEDAYEVTVDTTALSGTAAAIAVDLVDGNSAGNNISIDSITTDGVLGTAVTIGGGQAGTASGTGSVADAAFLNEVRFPITFGSELRIRMILSRGASGPLPDQLSLFLLAPGDEPLPLLPTTDETGADALASFDLAADEPPRVSQFAPAAPGDPTWSVVPVPEPHSLLAALATLATIAALAPRRLSPGGGSTG